MGWTEIKKAVNSTIGTEDFKPLDEIIRDVLSEQYIMSATDDLYYTFPTEYLLLESTSETDCKTKFTATRNGSIKVSVTPTFVLNTTSNTVKIKKNGSTIKEFTKVKYSEDTRTYTFEISKGDVITFSYISEKTSSYTDRYTMDISLYGKPEIATVQF